MEMKRGSTSAFFLSFVWIWVNLTLMKYCDRGWEKNNIKILVGDSIFVCSVFFCCGLFCKLDSWRSIKPSGLISSGYLLPTRRPRLCSGCKGGFQDVASVSCYYIIRPCRLPLPVCFYRIPLRFFPPLNPLPITSLHEAGSTSDEQRRSLNRL